MDTLVALQLPNIGQGRLREELIDDAGDPGAVGQMLRCDVLESSEVFPEVNLEGANPAEQGPILVCEVAETLLSGRGFIGAAELVHRLQQLLFGAVGRFGVRYTRVRGQLVHGNFSLRNNSVSLIVGTYR